MRLIRAFAYLLDGSGDAKVIGQWEETCPAAATIESMRKAATLGGSRRATLGGPRRGAGKDSGKRTLGGEGAVGNGGLSGFTLVRWTEHWRSCAIVVTTFFTSSPYERDGKEGGGFFKM